MGRGLQRARIVCGRTAQARFRMVLGEECRAWVGCRLGLMGFGRRERDLLWEFVSKTKESHVLTEQYPELHPPFKIPTAPSQGRVEALSGTPRQSSVFCGLLPSGCLLQRPRAVRLALATA